MTILNRTAGIAHVSALMLCLSVTGEVLAERTVAKMGGLHAFVSDENWCGPIVQVRVAAPLGSQLNANSRELQLLTGGVRQILTLECPGIQELQLTIHVDGQVEGRWRNHNDGQLLAMVPPTSSGSAASQALSTWEPSTATTARVALAQNLLSELGYHPGPADGLIGQRTRTAIAAFRLDRQLSNNDAVNNDLITQLRLARCGNPVSCDPGGREIPLAQAPIAAGSTERAMSSSSMPLSEVPDHTEQKVDQTVENTRTVPECDASDVHLQVMAAARQLPEPYSNWTLRGSTVDKIEIERGICSTELLFVAGHPEGLMTKVNITYKTDGEVSITDINAIKTPTESKTQILLGADNQSTIYGVVGGDEHKRYYIDVIPGKQVSLEVGPDSRPIAATVIGIGDMRQKFSFIATEARYEFLVAQLFRSVSDEEFWVRVKIE